MVESKKRIAVIDKELCKPNKCGNYLCIRVCPVNRTGKECVNKGKDEKANIIEDACIGCGICIKKCPFSAINIVNLPQELEEVPVHRFAPSEFVLYRLPFPMTNEIVGLVGLNGVGKTTALRILSGEIKPNLGQFEEEVDFSEVIKMFRGTELQTYLEKMKDRETRISYKPQRVDQIPKVHSGKVGKLLEKIDERKILNNLLKTFQLEEILERKINEVSGGELQRVAIIAALVKEADVYYFDEPTSFLDVFQRLSIAKVIKKFCKGKAALVVDHDLATLDFLADRIQIFYGVPGVYGVVSKPYGVRVGINTFLDGYIKEDNVRIRSEPISFFTSLIDKKTSPEILISFKNIVKKFDKFKLEVGAGDIRKKEVLAVLGANALGKTTFARILAGEFKADKGEISSKVKIAYKPQYLDSSFNGTVSELLSKFADVKSDSYKAEIVRPLSLKKLMEKNVKDISGGELQRISIASCLSQQVDLYLLDEPSAFLDVEQRLAVAKIINKIVDLNDKSSIVIDHDLLFLSQIGSRAMLFLGKSGIEGTASILSIKEGFNNFLKEVGVTFRKDPQTGRPRANKFDSQLDKEQKESRNYFYV